MARILKSVRAACGARSTGRLHKRGVLFKAARFAELVSGSILAGAGDAAGEGDTWQEEELVRGLQDDVLELVRPLILRCQEI